MALPSPIPEGNTSLGSHTGTSESSKEAAPILEAPSRFPRPPSHAQLQAVRSLALCILVSRQQDMQGTIPTQICLSTELKRLAL